jgi:hypothetical protein
MGEPRGRRAWERVSGILGRSAWVLGFVRRNRETALRKLILQMGD